jgi:hypothetical protein
MEAPSQVIPGDPRAIIPEASPISILLRRFFPIYCILTALVTFGYALYDAFQIDGDAIAYMDIGDYLRAHNWPAIVNGYWHPMYPAFLSIGHFLFRATLATELRAYYLVNFFIFLMEMLAVVTFTDAIVRLRTALQPPASHIDFLLDRYPLRYLGLALLVIASQRELSPGKVRPDALLQAFLLFALAALLAHLATNRMRYAALMGLALGCAYLTKSFAFVLAFLCILALAAYRWIWLKHAPARILPAALVAFICFAVVAGPYVAALSHQKHRLDFGDSGSLNYAWYVGGTEKMHLQPYQTSQFGSAEVHLKHPERELLHAPLILSYAALPYGTYPDWFDTTYWNDQIKPHMNLRGELPRAARNCVLVLRYLFNHPEALILLAFFLALGARLTFRWRPHDPRTNSFWLVPALLGVLIWSIYAIVNTEERYVTVAYLILILTLFATLRTLTPKAVISTAAQRSGETPAFLLNQPRQNNFEQITTNLEPRTSNPRTTASALIFLLALLTIGESLRIVLEDRRNLSVAGSPGGWYSPTQFHVADSLRSLGVGPGDTIACIGFTACLDDPYYARLDRVRILTEIYDPDTPVYPFLATLPNHDQAIATVREQGAKVLVADFDHARVSDSDPAFRHWQQLGGTTFYVLPLNLR